MLYRVACLSLFCINAVWSLPLLAGLETGRISPMGDLQLKVESGYYVNGHLAYPYVAGLTGYMQAGYAYLTVDSPHFAGLHQLNGRAGLEARLPWIPLMRLGGGISLVFVRGEGTSPQAAQYMLDDNESEFGWHARMGLDIVRREKWNAGLRLHWEEIWTMPETSALFWIGVAVEGSPW